ncbi:sensor histidine kinase [Carboxylicivirga caseinilyticus]|uniref:sensor histidine kinase n=1 Tax=Carboxylicivirga caseinilyticus TaxID=3417572 RepID=UPI003D3311D7|nr:histidine kinase [Marinilabiliaceae bacterium A049]
MRKKLSNVLWLFNLVIAIPLTLLIILAIPINFNQYHVNVSHINMADDRDHGRVKYYDLNNDGISERVIVQTDNYTKNASFQINDTNYNLLGQVNLEGKLNGSLNTFALGPIFDNEYHDISLLIIREDSIFLALTDISYYQEDNNIDGKTQYIFLDQILKNKYGSYDFTYGIFLHDADKNNRPEIYISLNAGYSIKPRKFYKYDPLTQKLFKSKTDGSCGNGNVCFYDFDNNGYDELFGACYAPWNIKDTTDYHFHDQNSYAMAFNRKLEFFFDPIINYGGFTSVNVQILDKPENPYIAVLESFATNKKKSQIISIYDVKGKRIKRTFLPKQKRSNTLALNNTFQDSLIWLINRDRSNIVTLNSSFDTLHTINIPVPKFGFRELQFNEQTTPSLLLYNTNSGIYNLWLNKEDFIPIEGIPPSTPKIFEISFIKNNKSIPDICIFMDGNEYIIAIHPNKYYIFKFPYYLLILIISFLTISFLFNIEKKRITKIYNERERLRELELSSTYNQLDPHFTFNVLNAIGGSIMLGKKEDAYEYFANLSELIRMTLIKAKDSARTLKEEIDFVRKYLEIERFRFGSKLDYNIEFDESIDLEIEIPKMLIQIFVENALKHGITPKDGNGQISISIINKNQTIKATIEDNGIGRAAAKSYNIKSTGKGLHVMNEYIDLFNQQKKRHIKFEITDKYNFKGEGTGTKVEITL